mgnify:FL=1
MHKTLTGKFHGIGSDTAVLGRSKSATTMQNAETVRHGKVPKLTT